MTQCGYASADGPPSTRGPMSTPADYDRLTPLVLVQALEEAGTVVCEPVVRAVLELPADALGPVMRALARLEAAVEAPVPRGRLATLEAVLPTARVPVLQRRLPGLTGGEGVLESSFAAMRPSRAPTGACDAYSEVIRSTEPQPRRAGHGHGRDRCGAPRAAARNVFRETSSGRKTRATTRPARVHNGLVDRRPALIVRCRTTDDVVAALEFARREGSRSASAAAATTSPGAPSPTARDDRPAPMKGIRVDPAGRPLRPQGGVLWGELNGAAAEHGLAVTGGAISTTGIAGLTLGGGLGWLMAKYGLAADNLLAVELVTAEGEVLQVDAESTPICSGRCAAAAATSASRRRSPTACTRSRRSSAG